MKYAGFFLKKNKKQLGAIFDWLSGIATKNDIILLEDDGVEEAYYFEFPLEYGDKPRRIKKFNKDDATFFIKFSSCRPEIDESKWELIFNSPDLKIYENQKRHQENQFKPLRRGLSEEEKKIALKIARKSLEIFLKERRIPEFKDLAFNFPLPFAFDLKTDLGLGLWADGTLRGSQIITNKVLKEGIIEAAVYACRDPRLKPLKFDELCRTRIEICICSDLKIPIGKNFIEKNEILYDKGYFMKIRGKSGWFLPEVFNIRPFKNLEEFLFRLAYEKASAPQGINFADAEIFIFEVEDFIENTEHKEILELDGPIVKLKESKGITESALLAADWLLKAQEPDGNFIPIINPLNGWVSQRDWPRSILTAWSLVEFGKAIGKPKYIEAGKKTFSYFKEYLLEEPVIFSGFYDWIISLAYLGQLALALDYRQEGLQCGLKIAGKESQLESELEFEPILFGQIGTFFAKLSKIDMTFFGHALKIADRVKSVFEINLKNKPPDAVMWAELANLYLKIYEISREKSHLDFVRKMADWLICQQFDSGAFSPSVASNRIFVRGTGKIAEVLAEIFLAKNKGLDDAFNFDYHKKSLEKAFEWLEVMQYTFENTYFIPKKNLNVVIGGFRHDYFNPDLWIDSAGHFLLGVSRFIKVNL